MILPQNVDECKVVILRYIERNPYLKAGTPEQVLKNLKAAAVSHDRSAQMHLDLSDTSDLQGMMMMSTDDSASVSSMGSGIRYEDRDYVPPPSPKKSTKFVTELEELERQEREIAMREEIVRKKKELDARRRKLEEDDK
jgi:hypothetical protein